MPTGPRSPTTARNHGSCDGATESIHAHISPASANGPYGMYVHRRAASELPSCAARQSASPWIPASTGSSRT